MGPHSYFGQSKQSPSAFGDLQKILNDIIVAAITADAVERARELIKQIALSDDKSQKNILSDCFVSLISRQSKPAALLQLMQLATYFTECLKPSNGKSCQ
jgi:hypothetical protein